MLGKPCPCLSYCTPQGCLERAKQESVAPSVKDDRLRQQIDNQGWQQKGINLFPRASKPNPTPPASQTLACPRIHSPKMASATSLLDLICLGCYNIWAEVGKAVERTGSRRCEHWFHIWIKKHNEVFYMGCQSAIYQACPAWGNAQDPWASDTSV